MSNEPAGQTVNRTAVIVTGGSALAPLSLTNLTPGAFVIAADSGLDHALHAGLRPDLVVGDLDSVQPAGIAWARANNVPIEVYPTDKDVTDTQLALGAAWSRQLDHIVVLSGGGDRLDHSISAITALGHESLAGCQIEARWGVALIHVMHGPGYWEFELASDTTFSLLALHGPCDRVTLDGAQWPLQDATIEPASSLGISNIAVDVPLRLTVGGGVLTLIVPYYFGAPA